MRELLDRNELSKNPINVYMTQSVLRDVCRISRAMEMSNGHLVLCGPQETARVSSVHLAALFTGSKIFSLVSDVHKTRKPSEVQSSLRMAHNESKPEKVGWKEELRDAVLYAVQESKSATFVVDMNEMAFSEHQAVYKNKGNLIDLVRCLHNLLLFGNPLDLWDLENLMSLGIVTKEILVLMNIFNFPFL